MGKFVQGKRSKVKRDSLRPKRGAVVVRVLVAVSLLAIGAGLLLPKLSPKRRIVTAFDQVGPSRIEGDTCFSEFFGFSIRLPHGWNVASETELKQRLAREEPSDRQNVVFILLVMKYPTRPRERNGFNSGLFVAAERLSNVPDVRTADEYLLESIELAGKNGREIGETKGPYKCTVGGEEFFGLDSRRRLQGRMVDTSHLATVKKGYFFTIFAAWESNGDGSVLKKSLDSVRFTNTTGNASAACPENLKAQGVGSLGAAGMSS